MTLNEAAARGIERLRYPKWADPMDHLRVTAVGGKSAPWVHLWAPFNSECSGTDPLQLLAIPGGTRVINGTVNIDPEDRALVAYTGPLPDSEEYRARVKSFEGCLGEDRGRPVSRAPPSAGDARQ